MPFYVKFSHFAISSFGLMITIGLLISYIITLKLSKYIGIIRTQIDDVFLSATFFGILIGRLSYIVKYHSQIPNLLGIFQIWNGGLDYYGTVVGVVLGVLVISWFYNIPPLKALDATSIIGSLMICFGFISAGLVGFGFGRPVPTVPDITPGIHIFNKFPFFYIVYKFGDIAPPSIPFYPVQFIYGLLFFTYAIILITYIIKKQNYEAGEIFSFFLILYGLTNMTIGHFAQSKLILKHINLEQFIGFLSFFVGTIVLWLLKSEKTNI